jgi:hypothetical protein
MNDPTYWLGELRHVTTSSISHETTGTDPRDGSDTDLLESEAWSVAHACLSRWSGPPTGPDPRPTLPSGALDRQTSQFFERALGHDVSGVILATGPGVGERLRMADAHGMAFGSSILLDLPWAEQSAEHAVLLLAHELVHVIQQGFAPRTGPAPDPALEVRHRCALGAQFATARY